MQSGSIYTLLRPWNTALRHPPRHLKRPQWLQRTIFERPCEYFIQGLCQGISFPIIVSYLHTLTNALPWAEMRGTLICFLTLVADWWKLEDFKLLLCVCLVGPESCGGGINLRHEEAGLTSCLSMQSFSAGRKQTMYIIWSNSVIYPPGTDLQSSELCLRPLNGFLTAALGHVSKNSVPKYPGKIPNL